MAESGHDETAKTCDLNLDLSAFFTVRVPKALHVLDLSWLIDFAAIEAFANNRRLGF